MSPQPKPDEEPAEVEEEEGDEEEAESLRPEWMNELESRVSAKLEAFQASLDQKLSALTSKPKMETDPPKVDPPKEEEKQQELPPSPVPQSTFLGLTKAPRRR